MFLVQAPRPRLLLNSRAEWQCNIRVRLRICPGRLYANAGQQELATTSSLHLRWEPHTSLGRLLIRPIECGEIQAASVVLTRAFASSTEAVRLSEVLKDIESMSSSIHGEASDPHAPSPSTPIAGPSISGEVTDCCFLIARLFPEDPEQASLPAGQDSRLVGTACISLTADAQSVRRLPNVNLPPCNAAYISNMAVDSRVRRRGVARALLAACEDVAASAGRREVWLHVREADAAARALYDEAGYVMVVKDSWLDSVRHGGMRVRVLMHKKLQVAA